jgi:ParB family chromosome partitioning protein
MNIQEIRISDISPDPDQPRKMFDAEALERLTQSIKDNGVEQPIDVKKNGAGYIIIDGERRWRAAKAAGLKEIPSIISADKDILEKQLRSDCLKEGLTVDELDRAIYRYYEHAISETSLGNNRKGLSKSDNAYCSFVAQKIGKSDVRVRKAIDRFEFKRDNQEFAKQIELKHGKDKFGKVNSTIAMTDKLKDKPEIRKETISAILEDRKKEKHLLDNEKIKEKVNEIAKRADSPKDVRPILEGLKTPDIKKDPRYVFSEIYFKFNSLKSEFEKYHFENFKEYVRGDCLEKFTRGVEKLLKQLNNLEK